MSDRIDSGIHLSVVRPGLILVAYTCSMKPASLGSSLSKVESISAPRLSSNFFLVSDRSAPPAVGRPASFGSCLAAFAAASLAREAVSFARSIMVAFMRRPRRRERHARRANLRGVKKARTGAK